MSTLGLAPKETLSGDIVSILNGYGMSVTLRTCGDHHVYVGTRFVLGLMKGEGDSWLGRENED
jgi:hypothetical protein